MKSFVCLAVIAAWFCFLPGCISVQDQLFLQSIEVEGSPGQPPVHITGADMKEGSVHASPHLSLGSGTVTAPLENQYEGPVTSTLADFQSKGLKWKLPRVSFGIDIDYAVSNKAALSGGISASVGKGRQFTSLYGGLGLYSASPNTAVRFDIGLQYVDVQYKGATVLFRTVGGGPQDTIYYLDQGKDFHLNLYANLTLNSAKEDQFLNWFLQVGISPQTLTSFVPNDVSSGGPGPYVVSDQRAESSVLWLSATPGLYFDLGDNRRLVFGARVMKELLFESSKPSFVVIPLLQFDWGL